MTNQTRTEPLDRLAELVEAWSEGVEPGPWHPAHRHGGPIVLDNANGDSAFVDADAAALLVNSLPSLIAAMREAEDTLVDVECDANCGALVEPVTEDQLRATLTHWREHEFLAGCAHGR